MIFSLSPQAVSLLTLAVLLNVGQTPPLPPVFRVIMALNGNKMTFPFSSVVMLKR